MVLRLLAHGSAHKAVSNVTCRDRSKWKERLLVLVLLESVSTFRHLASVRLVGVPVSYLVNAVFGLELARNRRAAHRRCVRPNPPGAPGEFTPAGALCVGGPKMGLPQNRQI